MFGSAFGGIEWKAFSNIEDAISRSGVLGLFSAIPFHKAGDEKLASGIVSSTRASTATYIDPITGFLKTAAIDEPRFELVNGVKERLIEGSSTNSVSVRNWRTSLMWGIGWGGANVLRTQQTNGDLAIDGVANKEIIITDNSVTKTIAAFIMIHFVDSLATDRATVLIKKGSATSIVLVQIVMVGGTSISQSVYIDTVTGLITGNGAVQDMGTHWLVSLTLQRNNSVNSRIFLVIFPAAKTSLASSLNPSLTGSVTIDYPMIELNVSPQSVPHSLIPGGTTRAADVVSITNANMPLLANGATFVVRGSIPNDGVTHKAMQAGVGVSLSRTGALIVAVIGGNVLSGVSVDTKEHVFAVRTNGTNLHELLVDGVVVSSSTAAGVVQPTAPLSLGSNAGASQFLDSHLSGVKIYDRAISDAETML